MRTISSRSYETPCIFADYFGVLGRRRLTKIRQISTWCTFVRDNICASICTNILQYRYINITCIYTRVCFPLIGILNIYLFMHVFRYTSLCYERGGFWTISLILSSNCSRIRTMDTFRIVNSVQFVSWKLLKIDETSFHYFNIINWNEIRKSGECVTNVWLESRNSIR